MPSVSAKSRPSPSNLHDELSSWPAGSQSAGLIFMRENGTPCVWIVEVCSQSDTNHLPQCSLAEMRQHLPLNLKRIGM